MKNTVELFVEYHNPETDEVEYAVSFAGYMTEGFLYLVKTSRTGDPKTDAVEYVKVDKADTETATDIKSICEPDEIRIMKVSSDEGIFDPRIVELSQTAEEIFQIDEAFVQLQRRG